MILFLLKFDLNVYNTWQLLAVSKTFLFSRTGGFFFSVFVCLSVSKQDYAVMELFYLFIFGPQMELSPNQIPKSHLNCKIIFYLFWSGQLSFLKTVSSAASMSNNRRGVNVFSQCLSGASPVTPVSPNRPKTWTLDWLGTINHPHSVREWV